MFPRDMVCLRNISADTLHKGYTEEDYYDDDDNNNNNNNNNNNLATEPEVSTPLIKAPKPVISHYYKPSPSLSLPRSLSTSERSIHPFHLLCNSSGRFSVACQIHLLCVFCLSRCMSNA